MNLRHLNIAITIGEPSGDLLGCHLMMAIKTLYPEVNFFGIGGPLMISQGFKSYFKYDDLAVMGYIEVIKNLTKILSIRRQVAAIILAQKPDIYIGIDAPNFNFNIEKKTYRQGITTIHYVSPSVWAWKPNRVEKIIQFTHNILCLFPMEPALYQRKGGNATYVGHPLASEIPLTINRTDSRLKLNLTQDSLLVTIMPGSRESEIKAMAPLFLQTALQLFQIYPNIQFFIPVTADNNKNLISAIIQTRQLTYLPIQFIPSSNKHSYISASNVTLVTSGTATLEVALCKCPMVISYVISSITYYLIKPFIHTQLFGLPNILLQTKVVPELIQKAATAETLFHACQTWIENPQACDLLQKKFMQLHQTLQHNTSELAAQAVLSTMSTRF